MEYLEFEETIKEIDLKIENTNNETEISNLITKRKNILKKIYSNLTEWQQVLVARHPQRPYSMDYIKFLTQNEFIEISGDRTYGDDKSIITGFGYIEEQKFFFIGQQKGRNSEERIFRNFGMPNPDGYRKALRIARIAERFSIPLIIFIDTPGAFAGKEGEEKGQAYAIANNIFEFFKIKIPIISIIIGEGGSGGALAIGIADKVYMLTYSIYSVISPESCSSIIFRTPDKKEESAHLLKLKAQQAYEFGLIDGIIEEPYGGAHRFFKETAENIKLTILKDIKALKSYNLELLLKKRKKKFLRMGDNYLEINN